MAIDIESFLITVGLMIGGAFVGSLVFRRFRVPDIILLIGLGVLLGPVLGFVDIDVFRATAPLVGTVAIIIILFEGGLKVRFEELARGVASGSVLAFLVFAATALLCALIGHALLGLDWRLALLLGMALGGAGVVIVIPLIHQMGVRDRTKLIVSIEAATSDVLVVVGVVGLATALQLQQTDPGEVARNLVQTFAVGIAAGLGAGFAWVSVLRKFAERSYEYVLTIATLFVVYAIVEILHGSGALAVLSMGLVVGNARKRTRVATTSTQPTQKRRGWTYAPVFGVDLVNLHQEMVFFIRAFFFVALGVVLNLDVLRTPRFLGVGFLLSVAVLAARFWGVTLVFGRSKMEAWDRLALTLMFPLGLAAAALSIVPSQKFGLQGTEEFGSYAAVVIVITNLLSSLLVYVMSMESVRTRLAAPPLEEPTMDPGRLPARQLG